jgi:hypothetical protein
MKKILFLILIIGISISININKVYAQVPVFDIPNTAEAALNVTESTFTAINSKIETGLQDIRNIQAVKDATSAYKQMQNYEETYYKASNMVDNIYGLTQAGNSIQSDLNNMRNLAYITPVTPTLNPSYGILDMINGEVMDTLNPNDPLSSLNGTTVQGTANNIATLKKYTANEQITTAQEDFTLASSGDKQSTALTNSAKNANVTTSGRLSATGIAEEVTLLAQVVRNEGLLNAAKAEQQKQQQLAFCESAIAYNLNYGAYNNEYEQYENSCTKVVNGTSVNNSSPNNISNTTALSSANGNSTTTK